MDELDKHIELIDDGDDSGFYVDSDIVRQYMIDSKLIQEVEGSKDTVRVTRKGNIIAFIFEKMKEAEFNKSNVMAGISRTLH